MGEENEYFGSPAVLQEDDYAWSPPLSLEPDDLPHHLADLDPVRCVQQSHAYRLWQDLRELGVGLLDGPGPFVDHAHYLEALGPQFRFTAQTDHAVLAQGPASAIEAMLRRLLRPGALRAGRFQLLAYLTRTTPLAHVRAAYQLARELGRIPA